MPQTYASRKEYQKKYQRDWMRKRRILQLKEMGGKCVQCDSTERLQMDHIDPTQKVAHGIKQWSKERRQKEMDKCQLLCASCHAKKTANHPDRGQVLHGRYEQGYLRGCKCVICLLIGKKQENKR